VLLHFKCFTSRLSLAVMPTTSFYQFLRPSVMGIKRIMQINLWHSKKGADLRRFKTSIDYHDGNRCGKGLVNPR
jgi:hypothetical protein